MMSDAKKMKIGVVGTGHIGKYLTRKLAAAGHDVKAANSRGPESIDVETLATGARAVTSAEALQDVDIAVISIPLGRLPEIAPLVAKLPTEAVLIDTSNYFPHRDGRIAALESGQVESRWVAEQLGRPVVKAWNSIIAESFTHRGQPAGGPGRIALPVAADRDADRAVALALVDATGFDAFHSGPIDESWRHQPGSPSYCTDLTLAELPSALAAAERTRLPKRRELASAVFAERYDMPRQIPPAEFVIRVHRALFM